jgi:tRNA threonylcarbamoyladenosine biosynthesis protein TsaE
VATETLYDRLTQSPEETLTFGREIAYAFQPPAIALLEGELGSGKTMLVKGIVAGLGAAGEDEVTSPTFTLVHEYGREVSPAHPGRGLRVYHVDLYRIEKPREIDSLGLDELTNGRSTVLIEWGEKLPNDPPSPFFRIRLEMRGENQRRIMIERIT